MRTGALLAALSCGRPEVVLSTLPPAVRDDPTPTVPGPPEHPDLPDLPPRRDGPLRGLVVLLSAGHGRLVQRSEQDQRPLTWDWQRRGRYGVIEDVWTAAFIDTVLAPRLEAAAAAVLPLRTRDEHADAVVLDAVDAELRGVVDTLPDPLAVGGATHRLAPDGAAVFTLTPPGPGAWWIYARWTPHPSGDPAARWAVHPAPYRAEIDTSVHGGPWWPLAEVTWAAGDPPVVVTLRGSGAGLLLVDGVRLGGGAYRPDEPALAGAPAAPLAQVASVHSLAALGGPPGLLTLPDGRHVSDMRFRARWSSWAMPDGADAVYVSVHSNAARGGKGTHLFYGVDDDTEPPTPARPGAVALADVVYDALRQRLPAARPDWPVRLPRPGDYSEISPAWNRVDGVIVEAGFHTRRQDVAALTDPIFQEALADGIVEALVAWRARGYP